MDRDGKTDINKSPENSADSKFSEGKGYTYLGLYEPKNRKTVQNAEKVAKAAIMARNMSHNLGSHVLSYIQANLLSIAERLKDSKGANFLSESNTRGLAHLMHYLQERQDFIATVATHEIPYFSPVPFKEAIFDCLNPDFISARHQNTPQISNYILDNIARSEGYTRNGDSEEKHKLRVCYYDGENVLEGNKNPEELNPLRNYTMFLPGGTVGRQAVMSIVENVIRNAAKHEKNSDDLIIYLQLLSAAGLKEHLEKNSNLSDEIKECYYNATDKDVLYYFLVSYAASNTDQALKTLDAGLNANYVDQDGEVAQSYKGIKEIRISASWLRGITDENEYKVRNLSPLVSVHQSNVKGVNVLQYIVGIRKSRKLSIVEEGFDNKFLEEVACDDWHTQVYKDSKEYNDDSFSNCAEYTVVSSNNILEQIREKAYNRVVVFNPNELTEGEKEYVETNDVDISEIYLKIISARFAREDISDVNKVIQIPAANDMELDIKFEEGIDEPIYISNDFEYGYKRHLDQLTGKGNGGWKQFKDDLSSGKFSNLKFVESITGSNSTIRLVSQMKLDEFWYYEQMYSMKSQIAIIDERFFDKTTLERNDGTKAILLKLAGIYLFNIRIDGNDNFCRYPIEGFVPKDNYCKQQCVTIGELVVDVENRSIEISINPEIKGKYPIHFNYISIHQGLLDKIYGKLGLTSDVYNKLEDMKGVTREIVNCLNQDSELPRLTIHSGRGKTEVSKMPGHVPFIQYSALYAALNDCKFSLVSLLSYSKYGA